MKKSEYEEKFNEMLEVDLEWHRMTKDDLKKLDEWFEELFEYISQVEEAQKEETRRTRPINTLLDAAEMWIKTSEGPFAKTLRNIVKESEREEE